MPPLGVGLTSGTAVLMTAELMGVIAGVEAAARTLDTVGLGTGVVVGERGCTVGAGAAVTGTTVGVGVETTVAVEITLATVAVGSGGRMGMVVAVLVRCGACC